jgi:hypothetical protein
MSTGTKVSRLIKREFKKNIVGTVPLTQQVNDAHRLNTHILRHIMPKYSQDLVSHETIRLF